MRNLKSRERYSPEISVIICHHTGDFIFKAVETVKKSVDADIEIIVMTSDSDLALTGIKGCKVMYSIEPPATKRNQGFRISVGKYLAFFDDDVEINEDCIFRMKEVLYEDVGMVYGKLYNMEFRNRFDEAGSFLTSTGFLWSRAGQNIVDEGQYNSTEYVLAGKSASCLIRADVFHEVGGFDEDFGILGEETDLAWRVWLYGYEVLYAPKSVAYHAFNTRFKPVNKHYTVSRVQFNGCRNYITMLLKNLGKEHLWIIPIHVSIWTFAGLAMIGTGKMRQGWNILKGLWYVLSNLKLILKKRERIQNIRVKTDSELWPYIFRNSPRGYYLQRFLRYLRIGLHG